MSSFYFTNQSFDNSTGTRVENGSQVHKTHPPPHSTDRVAFELYYFNPSPLPPPLYLASNRNYGKLILRRFSREVCRALFEAFLRTNVHVEILRESSLDRSEGGGDFLVSGDRCFPISRAGHANRDRGAKESRK